MTDEASADRRAQLARAWHEAADEPELPPFVASQPDREIVGIELSAGMVARARQRATDLPYARVVHGDAGPRYTVARRRPAS